ncbi:MAG: hypothetical protein LIO94_12165, partial [Clostridiales bacterium]|nr:hypothetical protein [Clostridiales bacterium]
MKKKMALFMALVMLAILPFDAVSAAGNGSGEAVIISEDVDGAAETTASEDTESGEIVVESAEKIQGETDAQQETAAESETQALDTTETESAAETEAEATTEAVTEAAAESEASQTEAVEAETSEGMTSQTELVEAETSEDMASVEAEEEIETSDAAASQAESSEDDAQAAETEADDGILVASVEEVESTEEEAGIQTASTSTELSVNKTYSLADIIGSTQYFSVSAAGRVQFIVQNSVNTSFGLYVYDTGLLSSYCKVSMTAGLESATSNYVTLPEAKQYSFKISGSTPNSEATLYIKYEAAGTYYGETESNDSFDTANGIQFNVEYEGMLGGSEDEIDYYKFTLSSSSKVGMSFDFLDTEMTEYNDV